MNKQKLLVAIVQLCMCVSVFAKRQGSTTIREHNRETSAEASYHRPEFNRIAETPLTHTCLQAQEAPPPPPPPPPPPSGSSGQRVTRSPVEPRRRLVGLTRDELKMFERYLPQGAQIYAYAVGNEYSTAALISTDLDGDGSDETVVIYNERKPTPEEGSLPLMMSILVRTGNKLTVRASLPILGGVLFTQRMKGLSGPFSVLDLIGKGSRQIVVVSGGGASVGGALQVLAYNGTALTKIGQIGGHFFAVHSQGPGRPKLIEARWKEEDQIRSYRWDGKQFLEVARRALK